MKSKLLKLADVLDRIQYDYHNAPPVWRFPLDEKITSGTVLKVARNQAAVLVRGNKSITLGPGKYSGKRLFKALKKIKASRSGKNTPEIYFVRTTLFSSPWSLPENTIARGHGKLYWKIMDPALYLKEMSDVDVHNKSKVDEKILSAVSEGVLEALHETTELHKAEKLATRIVRSKLIRWGILLRKLIVHNLLILSPVQASVDSCFLKSDRVEKSLAGYSPEKSKQLVLSYFRSLYKLRLLSFAGVRNMQRQENMLEADLCLEDVVPRAHKAVRKCLGRGVFQITAAEFESCVQKEAPVSAFLDEDDVEYV